MPLVRIKFKKLTMTRMPHKMIQETTYRFLDSHQDQERERMCGLMLMRMKLDNNVNIFIITNYSTLRKKVKFRRVSPRSYDRLKSRIDLKS